MTRKGRKFELEYEWLYKLDQKKYKVTSPAMLYDKTTNSKREVDVLVEYTDEYGLNRKIGIECRDRKNIQDSMWIEQLTTKKNDLELDCIIATTTKSFTKNAIKKAEAHGVVIERAETFDKTSIDNLSKELYLDMFFLKFEFVNLIFRRNGKLYKYKELIRKLNVLEQYELLLELKGSLYWSLNPYQILDNCNFKKEDFYKDERNYLFFKQSIEFRDDGPKIFKKLDINYIYYEIQATPLKVSYPVSKQVSVFNVEKKQNKKFKVRYGTDDEYYECGYIDDGKIQSKLVLKDRKYYRFIEMNMCVNTIFPDGYQLNANDEFFDNKMIGEISFEKII